MAIISSRNQNVTQTPFSLSVSSLDIDGVGQIVASRAFRVPDMREADHSRDIQWTRRAPGVLRVLRQEILRDLQPVQEGYRRRK